MPGRVVAAAWLSMAAVLVASVPAAATDPASSSTTAPSSATMCPPVTLADLFPDPAPPEDFETPEEGEETPGGEEPAPPADTQPAEPPPAACTPFVYPMLFPLVVFGDGGWSPFGAPRDGGARAHAGVDVPAPKLAPVVAVADGTIDWISRDETRRAGQAVGIRHADGWRSIYVHLNNDTAGTDDGAGNGIRPGLEVGTPVVAGQVIGWVGDSGNAEDSGPHLHFELRMPGNVAVDGFTSLRGALRTPHPLSESTDPVFSGAYQDDDGHPFEHLFDLAVSLGLDLSCDEYGLQVCPDDAVTGTEAVGWLSSRSEADPEGIVPAYRIPEAPAVVTPEAVAAAKDPGCGVLRFCSDQPLTRAEAAALVAAVSGGDRGPSVAYLTLHGLGRLDTCIPGVDVGNEPITRAGFLVMLFRWEGYLSSPPCSLVS
jgi:murein DD-endopeptidase MepM/ murein hydrolase activator NlpD